jgi:membrane protein DedA with SNARE-associated domain
VLASFGVLELPQTLLVAAAGALAGDNVGYVLGRRLGRPWLERHGRQVGLHPGMLARVDALFATHGRKAVLIGRFIGFLRAMAPFAAGAAGMPYRRFAPYNAIGAIAWALVFVLLGHFLGTSWSVAEKWIGRAGLVAGTLALAAAVWWFRRHRRSDATPRGRGDSG